MARFLTSHPKTPPLDARLRGQDGDGHVRCHSRESGNPAISRKRSLGTAWRLSLAGIACLMVAPSLAYAHGGMAGPEELGPPIFTSGLLGFVCYWLVMLWPAPKKKGNPEVGSGRQNRHAPRTQGRSLKKSVHVKQVSRLRKIERNGQFSNDQHSGRKASDG